MKIQNIIALVILSSVVFIGCKKDNSIQLKNSKPEVEVNEFQPSLSIADEGDDDDELLDKKRKLSTMVMKSGSNVPVEGAEVRLFNASTGTEGYTDASGMAILTVPTAGDYQYQVMYQGQVVVDEFVSITNSTMRMVTVE